MLWSVDDDFIDFFVGVFLVVVWFVVVFMFGMLVLWMNVLFGDGGDGVLLFLGIVCFFVFDVDVVVLGQDCCVFCGWVVSVQNSVGVDVVV